MLMHFTLHHTSPTWGTVVGKAHSLAAIIMQVEGLIQDDKSLDGLTLDVEDMHGNLLHHYNRGSREYLWH